MVKKACVNNSSSGVTPNYLTCNEVYINTCDKCSELRAYLRYGHWPVPRCPDKGRLGVQWYIQWYLQWYLQWYIVVHTVVFKVVYTVIHTVVHTVVYTVVHTMALHTVVHIADWYIQLVN